MKIGLLFFFFAFIMALGYTVAAKRILARSDNDDRRNFWDDTSANIMAAGLVVSAIVGILLTIVLAKSWIIVGPAETMAIYNPLAGGIQHKDYNEGWRLVPPWSSTRKFSKRFMEYTMSKTQKEGAVMGDDSMACQTKEGLGISLDATVIYRIPQGGAWKLWKSIGPDYNNILVRPSTRNVVKLIVSNYGIMEAYSNAPTDYQGQPGIDFYVGKRSEIEQKINTDLKKQFAAKGLELDWFLMRNVDYDPNSGFENSIIEKQVAQQNIETQRFMAEVAKIKASSAVALAEGESRSIKLRAQALQVDPRLVGFEWTQVLGKNENLEVEMLPDSVMPVLHLNKRAAAAVGE